MQQTILWVMYKVISNWLTFRGYLNLEMLNSIRRWMNFTWAQIKARRMTRATKQIFLTLVQQMQSREDLSAWWRMIDIPQTLSSVMRTSMTKMTFQRSRRELGAVVLDGSSYNKLNNWIKRERRKGIMKPEHARSQTSQLTWTSRFIHFQARELSAACKWITPSNWQWAVQRTKMSRALRVCKYPARSRCPPIATLHIEIVQDTSKETHAAPWNNQHPSIQSPT